MLLLHASKLTRPGIEVKCEDIRLALEVGLNCFWAMRSATNLVQKVPVALPDLCGLELLYIPDCLRVYAIIASAAAGLHQRHNFADW